MQNFATCLFLSNYLNLISFAEISFIFDVSLKAIPVKFSVANFNL